MSGEPPRAYMKTTDQNKNKYGDAGDSIPTNKQAEKVFWWMTLCAVVAFVAAICQAGGGDYHLEWESSEPTNSTVFEIWRGTNATGPFSPWATVAETRVPMPTGEPMGFFIVRASNTLTHLVSEWSH